MNQMINKKLQILVLLMAGIFISATASATPIGLDNLAIDFRSSDWNGAKGQQSFTNGNITVSAGGIGNWADNRDLQMYQDAKDGLGVQAFNQDGEPVLEQDEINKGEKLTVSIDNGMWLSGVWVSDLFDYEDSDEYDGENFGEPEYGRLIINGDDTINFTALNGQFLGHSNGERWVSFGGGINVSTISFFAGKSSEQWDKVDTRNEYSVIGFTPVPEPATMLLLGSGLLAGAGIFRKKTGIR